MHYPQVKNAPLDLIDKWDHYTVQVELPGMTKEDVQVTTTADHLLIQAQKSYVNEHSDTNYLHRERYSTIWRRDVRFPEEVYPDQGQGTMKDGVLDLTIPKKEATHREQRHSITIE